MNRSEQWVFMDYLKRGLFLKYEIKKFILKSILKNSQIPLTYRYYSLYIKIKNPRWSIKPQVVNRCVRTGRSLSVTKKTRYSRFVFRTESYRGNLPGFKRASW